jgi:hypothetical protein
VTSDSVHYTSLELFASQYSTEGQIKGPNLLMEAGQSLLGAASSYARGDIGGIAQSVAGFVRGATTGRSAQQRSRQIKASPADVVRRLLFLSFRWLIIYRYHGVGAKTLRQVQILRRLVPLLAP